MMFNRVVDNKWYEITFTGKYIQHYLYRLQVSELRHLELDLPVTVSAYRVIYDGYSTNN